MLSSLFLKFAGSTWLKFLKILNLLTREKEILDKEASGWDGGGHRQSWEKVDSEDSCLSLWVL